MNKTFIIAEAGVNHNGKKELAYKLIDSAKEAGVDAVKFQTFKTEKIVSKYTDMAEYQKKNIGEKNETQFEMIKKLELSYSDFKDLKKYCDDIGIMFLSTPDDEDSLNFLSDEVGVEYLKIGSGEITNFLFLEKIAKKNKKIILSTGMSTLGEVEKAINIIKNYNNEKLYILHCTTNYPCPYDEVNLKAMKTIKKAFKVNVGYSDHTLGIEVPVAAVAMGAEIIEKHFTIDNNLEGPDHKASLNPKELKDMVYLIRNIEQALGNGIKKPNKSEEKVKNVVRRKIVAKENLKKNTIIKEENIILKRANYGIESEYLDLILGKKIKEEVKEDCPICWECIIGKE